MKSMSNDVEIDEVPLSIVWQLRNSIMYPESSLDFVKLEGDLNGTHFGLKVRGEVVSVLSVFYKDDRVQFRKFCTKVKYQGMGYGTALLTYLFAKVKIRNQYRLIWCNARVNAASFYEKFGMHVTDQVYTENGYDFVVMECNI